MYLRADPPRWPVQRHPAAGQSRAWPLARAPPLVPFPRNDVRPGERSENAPTVCPPRPTSRGATRTTIALAPATAPLLARCETDVVHGVDLHSCRRAYAEPNLVVVVTPAAEGRRAVARRRPVIVTPSREGRLPVADPDMASHDACGSATPHTGRGPHDRLPRPARPRLLHKTQHRDGAPSPHRGPMQLTRTPRAPALPKRASRAFRNASKATVSSRRAVRTVRCGRCAVA